ncbi:hypothetical protein ANCDUO_08053 [Ancylostoma duodenale]|uniref:Uncharacterized protein n=1 Tax=Ancylostoma duodenale TaxID=51022 RepID=A0A0C2GKA2_9BILA|nr:hypothetical protein ANCDUO_08053 [Ancylostoma duodenale]
MGIANMFLIMQSVTAILTGKNADEKEAQRLSETADKRRRFDFLTYREFTISLNFFFVQAQHNRHGILKQRFSW